MAVQYIFVNDVKWLSIAQVFLRLKGLIVIPIMTHALGAWNYGVWTQCVAVASLFLPFVLWGMNHGYTRYASSLAVDRQLALFSAWLIFILVVMAAVSSLVVAFGDILSSILLGGVSGAGYLIYFSLGFCLTNALFQSYTAWLKVSGKSKFYSIILVVQGVVSLFPIIFFIYYGGDVFVLVGVTLFFDFLFVIVLIFMVFFTCNWVGPDYSNIWKVFRFSVPLMPLTFAYLGISWGDRLILLDHMTISEVGVYNLSHGVALMLVQTLAQPFWAYYPTRFTALYEQGDIAGMRQLYTASAISFMTLTVPAVIGLTILASDLLSMLAPDEFLAGGGALVLLVAGYSTNIMTGYYDQYLQVQYRQKWITISLLCCFILNIIFNYLLIPIFGITGAGIASLVAFAFRFFFVILLVKGQVASNLSIGYLIRVSLCGLLMGCAVKLTEYTQIMSLDVELRLVISTILGALVFFALACVFKVIKLRAVKQVFFNRG